MILGLGFDPFTGSSQGITKGVITYSHMRMFLWRRRSFFFGPTVFFFYVFVFLVLCPFRFLRFFFPVSWQYAAAISEIPMGCASKVFSYFSFFSDLNIRWNTILVFDWIIDPSIFSICLLWTKLRASNSCYPLVNYGRSTMNRPCSSMFIHFP